MNGHELEEGVQGGQAVITGPRAVAALVFEVIEEPAHKCDIEIFHAQLRRRSAEALGREPEQQAEGVPATVYGLAPIWFSNRSVKKRWRRAGNEEAFIVRLLAGGRQAVPQRAEGVPEPPGCTSKCGQDRRDRDRSRASAVLVRHRALRDTSE